MCAWAALARWQPGIDSPVGASQYAVEPSASARDEAPFVLPTERPGSPEISESPSVTTVGVPTPGPSASAGGARPSTTPQTTTIERIADRMTFPLRLPGGDPLRRCCRCQPAGGTTQLIENVTPAGSASTAERPTGLSAAACTVVPPA